jgi:hypothetical protein
MSGPVISDRLLRSCRWATLGPRQQFHRRGITGLINDPERGSKTDGKLFDDTIV